MFGSLTVWRRFDSGGWIRDWADFVGWIWRVDQGMLEFGLGVDELTRGDNGWVLTY